VGERVAEEHQPLIVAYDLQHRPERWVNIYSRLDWISGSLEYYDNENTALGGTRRVQNVHDPHGTTPLLNHTRYWKHRVMEELLFHAVTKPRDYTSLDQLIEKWRQYS
jgi:hypothetical protein